MKLKKANQIILLIVILLLTACTATKEHEFTVNIESSTEGTAPTGQTFILVTEKIETPADNEQAQNIASYLNSVLIERGFVSAKENEPAEMVINFSYGIGNPQQIQTTKKVPIWDQMSVKSDPNQDKIVYLGTKFGVSSNAPGQGVVGYTEVKKTITVFDRFIRLDAYDGKEYQKKNKVLLWNIKATSTGPSSQPEEVFPVLVTAIKSNIATNNIQSIVLYDTDSSLTKGKKPYKSKISRIHSEGGQRIDSIRITPSF